MLITPFSPALVAGKRLQHGSNLDEKTLASRVSSQWKSTENGQILVDSDDLLSQIYTSRKATHAKVRITDWRVDRIELAVETSSPAMVN